MSNALTDENGTDENEPGLRGRELRKVMSLVTLAWMFGSVWLTATAGAPMTRYATSLNATGFQFGLLSAMPFVTSLISLPASLLIERTGKRKGIFLWGLYLNRVLWLPIALVPFWVVSAYGMGHAPLAMNVFLVLLFVMHSGQATGGPAWVSWMSDVVPDRLRGRYFSVRRQLGILPAIPAALFVGWLLGRLDPSSGPLVMLQWCAVIFICAMIPGIADIVLYHFIPDPAPPMRAKVRLRDVFTEPLHNKPFLWFSGCVAMMTLGVSFMGQFVTLFMMEKLHVTDLRIQLMVIVAPAAAQLVSFKLWGRAADRMGKKPILALAALGLVPVGIGWCFVSASNLWLGYLLSALGQLLWTGVEVANLNIALELGGADDGEEGGSHYVAANSVIVNIAGCAGGLLAGLVARALRDWDADFLGRTITYFEVLFIGSAVIRLLAVVVFLPRLHEPTAKPTREALRFITSSIYNNLYSVIQLPVRVLRGTADERRKS